jgi:hypothetical protein
MQRAEALKEIIHDRSMAMDTGELGAVKIACPVRRGVAGKGFHTRIPRRRPTLRGQQVGREDAGMPGGSCSALVA